MNAKYLGLVFLAIWLIVQGLERTFEFYFPYEEKVLPAINFLAGGFLAGYCIKLKHGDIGLFLLGCWAILSSVLFLFHFSFEYSNKIVNGLSLAAGILLILKI